MQQSMYCIALHCIGGREEASKQWRATKQWKRSATAATNDGGGNNNQNGCSKQTKRANEQAKQ